MNKYTLHVELLVHAENRIDAEDLGFIYLRDMLNQGLHPPTWSITDARDT